MTRHGGRGLFLRVPVADLRSGEVALPKRAAHYVARVHRLKPGDRFVAFDPAAELEAEAEILTVERTRRSRGQAANARVRVRLCATRPASARPARAVTLIQAVGKGTKLDGIVRDATELGVTRFAPVVSERSIKRPATGSTAEDRWRRVAVEAARQCGRGDAPGVEPIGPLAAALERHAPISDAATPLPALGLCLHPEASEAAGEALAGLAPAQSLTIVVGPEGGLSDAELERARSFGYHLIHLGPLVLRTETVCAALLGAVLVWGAPDPHRARAGHGD